MNVGFSPLNLHVQTKEMQWIVHSSFSIRCCRELQINFLANPITRNSQDVRASLVAQMVKNLPAMQETWIPSLGWEDPLEKGVVTPSSSLAWRIPWSEEPGGLQFMGSQRVEHDWATNTWLHYTDEHVCQNSSNMSCTCPNLLSLVCNTAISLQLQSRMRRSFRIWHFGK